MIIRIILFIALLGVIFFIFPNIFNEDEKRHFSSKERLEHAIENYAKDYQPGDSVDLALSAYYADRSRVHLWLFGEKYRDIWNTKVSIPVLTENDQKYYQCYDIGGGMQTIAIKIKDNDGKVWTLRSVDKDQSAALSPFLRYSLARPIFRDVAAAMNPFGAVVVDDLSEAAGIAHTNPKLVFVPYINSWDIKCRDRMAGRVSLLEEELDEEGWSHHQDFFRADTIVDSDDMLAQLIQHPERSVDTLSFLKARLFDILISDWDRHEGNWAWALVGETYLPIPIDRDMAFYKFDDGMLNKLVLLFNNKFRSFHPQYYDIKGFAYNSKFIDQKILKGVKEEFYIAYADSLQQSLTDSVIEKSFEEYPDAVFEKTGKHHISILKSRRDQLKMAAKSYFAAINSTN